MKGLEINEESLEDLLTYDDLFLDYFNTFLQMPTFAQRQYYNRLTGTFMEYGGNVDSVGGSVVMPTTPPYGATDEERERILEWAKEERLPVFLKSRLFREFKMCKLLMRPLDDRYRSASRGSSRNLRGYSRQTESYVSSLSNSADNSANDATTDYEEGTWSGFRRSALFRYQRPGSNAISLPPGLGLFPVHSSESARISSTLTSSKETGKQAKLSSAENKPDRKSRGSGRSKETSNLLQRERSEVECETADSVLPPRDIILSTRNDTLVSIDENAPVSAQVPKPVTGSRKSISKSSRDKRSSKTPGSRRASGEKRTNSAPSNREEDDPAYRDYDVMYGEDEPEHTGEVFVAFAEEPISEQQTETDLRNLEGKHQMSLQQMKEQVLSSLRGMEEFKSFLKHTAGEDVFSFWLDCEYFKDTMEEYDEVENMAIRNQLFRDIQDKFRMNLTNEAKRNIRKTSINTSLCHTIFIRTQYDVLRRLRSYWLPRYLIHKERMNQLSTDLKKERLLFEKQPVRKHPTGLLFPSISLVNSLPVYPEDILQIAKSTSWETVIKRGRSMEDRVTSARIPVQSRAMLRTMREKFIMALSADKEAGSPFRRYLERTDDQVLLNNLLFWEDVTEYGAAEDRSADRLLRMVHAWAIYNKYISPYSTNTIIVPPRGRDFLHKALLKSTDFVAASVYDQIKQNAVDLLEKTWIRYLKEDLKAYIECHIRPPETPPSTAEDFEVLVDDDMSLVVYSKKVRPWVKRYPPSSQTERGQRLRTALSVAESIDEGRKAEAKARAKERRKQMEKERKKAIRAARARQREAKKGGKTPTKSAEEEVKEEEEPGFNLDDTGMEEEKDATFHDMVTSNNKPVIGLFKKYLSEKLESKEGVNQLSLYLDVDAYYTITGEKASITKQKKDVQAGFIFKTYFDSNGRKKVAMNDKVYSRLSHEKERPKTATLKESQSYILAQLEEHFANFLKTQAEELGLDPKSLATMSAAEMAMRADDDATLYSSFNKRKGKSGIRQAAEEDAPDQGVPESVQSEESKLSLSNLISRSPTDMATFKLSKSKLHMSKSDSRRFRQNRDELDFSQSMRSNQKFRMDAFSVGGAGDPSKVTQKKQKTFEELMDKGESTTVKKHRKKADGRAQPSREDKVDFLVALNSAAQGKFNLQMLYFWKFLVRHGEEDGFPYIENDLFFYTEVQKFKDASHLFCDEEMLRRKVQSILDCFLDSTTPPSLQVDIPVESQGKAVRNAQKYLTGKEISSSIFDEAQYQVFRELLPFWAGFVRTYKTPDDNTKKPVTKKQKELKKRLESFQSWNPPKAQTFYVPDLPRGAIATFSFSLADGLKWKSIDDTEAGGYDDQLSMVGSQGGRSTGMNRPGRRYSRSLGPDGLPMKRLDMYNSSATISESAAKGSLSVM